MPCKCTCTKQDGSADIVSDASCLAHGISVVSVGNVACCWQTAASELAASLSTKALFASCSSAGEACLSELMVDMEFTSSSVLVGHAAWQANV